MLKRRIGKFCLSSDLIEGDPESVMQILGQCVVVRAEYFYHLDMVEYIALCPMFHIAAAGELVRTYTWIKHNREWRPE